jgi:hypothetical protein
MTKPPVSVPRVVVNVFAVLAVLLIMAGMIWIMYHYTRPSPVDRARAVERKTAREEITAQGRELLGGFGWINQPRGVARLSIARAMELTVQGWQDPAAGRSDLLARFEKATPPLPAVPTSTNSPASTNVPGTIKAPVSR